MIFGGGVEPFGSERSGRGRFPVTGPRPKVARLQGLWLRLKGIGRILSNTVRGAEVAKGYPETVFEILWNRLPVAVRSLRVVRAIGHVIHRRAQRLQQRGEANETANYTRFFRNLPQLELIRDLTRETPRDVPLKIAILGCSTGAELYSAVWMMRTAWPQREVRALGIDLSEAWIQTATSGIYPIHLPEVAEISEGSFEGLFSRHGDTLHVQAWLKEGVQWWVGDACSTDLAAAFGLQNVVFANNFLFHMDAKRSGSCLRSIARLVAPDGYLVLSGVDLDVRSRIVQELGLVPVTARIQEIYTAEEGMLAAWPFRFWGLEPIDQKRQDWPTRYTTIFRLPGADRHARAQTSEGADAEKLGGVQREPECQ